MEQTEEVYSVRFTDPPWIEKPIVAGWKMTRAEAAVTFRDRWHEIIEESREVRSIEARRAKQFNGTKSHIQSPPTVAAASPPQPALSAGMLVTVVKIRKRGIEIPKARWPTEPYIQGELLVRVRKREGKASSGLVAEVRGLFGEREELQGPSLVFLDRKWFVLKGIEHVDGREDFQANYLQSWIVIPEGEANLFPSDREAKAIARARR